MSADSPALFQHTRRPEWGLAIIAKEKRDSRDYQFQDGKIRTIKEGYYHLLEEIERPGNDAERIASELGQQMDRLKTRERMLERAKKEGKKIYTVKDQLALFLQRFPGGFQDPMYEEEVRGSGEGGRRKRDRDLALEVAAEKLSLDVLNNHIDNGDVQAVLDAWIAVLGATDIASTSTDSRPLKKLEGQAVVDFAFGARSFLYDEASITERFTNFVGLLFDLGVEKPTWPMITVPLGLLNPTEHYCIKPSVYRTQSRRLAPEISYTTVPTATVYNGYKRMADELNKQLRKAELEPRDNIDIFAFIWETMRPGVRKALESVAR
jgi:hypothetical protein